MSVKTLPSKPATFRFSFPTGISWKRPKKTPQNTSGVEGLHFSIPNSTTLSHPRLEINEEKKTR